MSTQNLLNDIHYIVPGLIIVFLRAQFLTGRRVPHSEAILTYIIISVIYLALVQFLDGIINNDSDFFLLLTYFVIPVPLGILLGICAQKDLFRRFARFVKLKPVNVIPSAWDWKVSMMKENREGEYVVVTLKDDKTLVGYCGFDSFIPSDGINKERDLYLDKLFHLEDNDMKPLEQSILIMSGEIKTIEFFPGK